MKNLLFIYLWIAMFIQDSCQMTCSLGCAANHCQTNGRCTQCVDGYRDTNTDCIAKCSEGCYNMTCESKGRCEYGCKAGYFGDNCCPSGWFGWSCEIKCPINCFNCTSADICKRCNDGFYGTTCNSQCQNRCQKCTSFWDCSLCKTGFYGPYCEQNCPNNCMTCTSRNECQSCIDGFYGQKCDILCPRNCEACISMNSCSRCAIGFGGEKCQINCLENCMSCDEANMCTSCKEGFERPEYACQCQDSVCYALPCMSCTHISYYLAGTTCCPCSSTCKNALCTSVAQCTHGCENGNYGVGCQFKCTDTDRNCGVCDGLNRKDVKCTQCIDGYYPKLNELCTQCSAACFGGTCSNHTGNCIKGCLSGFWNLSCESRCKAKCSICDQESGKCLACSSTSQYGNECSLTCSDNCVNASCHINGTCTSGCIADFIGPSCGKQCPSNCARKDFETRCSNETGICLFGCSAGFTGVNCMEALKPESSKGTVPSAAIGGGVAVAVIVVVVVSVAVFFYLRRRHRQPKHDGVQETSNYVESPSAPVYASAVRSGQTGSVYENTSSVKVHNAIITMRNPVYSNSQKQPNMSIDGNAIDTEDILEIDEWDTIARQNAIKFEENGGVYYNNDEKVNNLKIQVAELKTFVSSKTMDYYEAEFKKLPYGLLKDYKVSQMKANLTKNRYKGIYPYDDHRVKVRGGDTDYINASFIDGYKRRNEYIATLGPMSKQLGDFGAFWKMVCQQNVEIIVMVTNLVEEGKDKCEQYWPNVGASQMYGGIRVSCTSEDEFAQFTRRSFAFVKDRQARTLTQLHFTSWPDKDIPEDVTSIIEFRQNVIRAPATLGGPIIVHCSAGVGRTGTYIAIDILTKEGEAEGAIDIPGCVLNMRQNRPNMVQTAGQYKYLHRAVVHSLTLDCNPVAGAKFQLYMDTTSKDKIRNMFQQIQDIKTYGSLDETEAVERNAKRADKNREGADIPGDEHRLRLYLNRKPGSTDYINAVFVNSFQTKNKYVLAQTPLPNTVADFIAMLVQTECSCIVTFEPSTMRNGDIGEYLPADNQLLKKGIFSVRCSKQEANAYRIKRTMTIEHRANQANAELSLTHLEFSDWNMEEPIPNSPSDFRRFIAEVDAVTASTNFDKPVVVHCWDGASKCGLFCIVATLLQKIALEQEVSVVNAVRTVKARRKGAIPNLEQFQFCHDCVLDYVQSFNIYANVAAELSDC